MTQPLQPLPQDASYDQVTDKLKELREQFDELDDQLIEIANQAGTL